VLRRPPGISLGFGDPELIEGVLDIRRYVVPVTFRAVVGWAQVVKDVVEVDLAQVRRWPGWHRFALKDVQRAQTKLEHPQRFLFMARDLLDDIAIEATPGLEGILLRVTEPVLVVLGQRRRASSN